MYQTDHIFEIEIESFPDMEFTVLEFNGHSALNSSFHIDVKAMIERQEFEKLQISDLLGAAINFTMKKQEAHLLHKSEGDGPQASSITYHAMIQSIEVGEIFGDNCEVTLSLESPLGALKGLIQTRLYLDASGPDMVKETLSLGGISEDDCVFKLGSYPKWDFFLEKDDDSLEFILRTLAHEGISLFFNEGKINFCDSNDSFVSIKEEGEDLTLVSSDISNLGTGVKHPLFNFKKTLNVPARTLRLRDYNWENPNRKLEVEIDVAKWGHGEVYLYGEGFDTVSEGNRLIVIRKEEILSNTELMYGETILPGLFPGCIFSLKHPKIQDANGRYLVREVEFSGRISSPYNAPDDNLLERGFILKVSFQSVEQSFRPKRLPKKEVTSISGWIAGDGSGESPEIDSMGRYKVLFPFDTSGRSGGKCSSWIRKASPYVGFGYGQHMPLYLGTEVLVGFIDNHPGKPYISSAICNGETGSFINSGVSDNSGVSSQGGSALMFDNEAGSQTASLSSGTAAGIIAIKSDVSTKMFVQADRKIIFSALTADYYGFQFRGFNGFNYNVKVANTLIAKLVAIVTTLFSVSDTALNVAKAETGSTTDAEKTKDDDTTGGGGITDRYDGQAGFSQNRFSGIVG
ncbi:MAG: type VI secretion system tip protein VgrG [Deltaproteobacteria bacterium]|jgi:type VI secretion system secreted protein VgrG|nr:type VI secretion system tip protein VgrG [Deltaproteobacteria bacterium]